MCRLVFSSSNAMLTACSCPAQCGHAHSLLLPARSIECKLASTSRSHTTITSRKYRRVVFRRAAASGDSSALNRPQQDSSSLPENFCIIESREAVKDFENLQLEEINSNIQSRRNKIFLLMEEVRRLRIQQRLKGGDLPKEVEMQQETYLSALPLLPPLTEKTLNNYYTFYVGFFAAVIIFGGLLAPILEVKLGVGGTSYREFVESMRLPSQLAEVDPIVASFCGGAVGVLSALLVVEVNNIKKQQQNRCLYCEGTGYLMCGNCIGAGLDSNKEFCAFCAGTGKVMCTACLCTGKKLATEYDPRIDPFI